MWIRSQNKSVLIDARNVFISEDFEGEWYYIIKSAINADDWASLGRYKKKEIALEILDMIQLRIVQSYLHKRHKPTRCLANAEDVVFEMPKDVPDVAEKN